MKITTTNYKKCDRPIRNCNLEKHLRTCSKIKINLYTCKCNKTFDNPQKFNGHKRWCETYKGIGNVLKGGGGGWSKGLTKETNSSLMSSSTRLKARYASGEIVKTFTADGLKRLSVAAKKNNSNIF